MQSPGFYSLLVASVLQFAHRRLRRPRIVSLNGLRVQLCPRVFNPTVSRTTRFFLQHMEFPTGSTVLEIGTGTGVIAAAAARRSNEVWATDISPYAVQCARATMRLNNVDAHVKVLLGDLFAPVKGRSFDVILFSLPYLARTATSLEGMAWCAGPKCELVNRFLAEARTHLKTAGSIQILFSSAAPVPQLITMIRQNGYRIRVLSSGRILGFLERVYLLKLSLLFSDVLPPSRRRAYSPHGTKKMRRIMAIPAMR